MTPEVGQVWEQRSTAAMRAENVTRTVRIVHVDGPGGFVQVVPAEGKGRMSHIRHAQFLRRFTRREATS
ncbi:hypothetical protein [Mycobacterium sp.]|uniref:hypothetical protein n=1 Tax=Mycobacterium sp. TaxID=1785 RepID=UPI002BF69B3A|nr:hypothetical protein [Mycobacterium sp.]HTY35377.1 hypothetical protein [Mycobacterium sp.]